MAAGDGFVWRKVHTITDEALAEAGRRADGEPLRKVAVAVVGRNPWAAGTVTI